MHLASRVAQQFALARMPVGLRISYMTNLG